MKKLIILLLFFGVGCTDNKTPEEKKIKKYYRVTGVTKDSLKIKSEVKYAN